jgi:imidazolonepropionase-like amidohydrolase
MRARGGLTVLVTVLVMGTLSMTSLAQHAQLRLPPTTAYVGATLIDGTGAAPVQDSVVLVQGERIAAAGPRASVTVPDGAALVSVEGRWIMPGLIDAHVHFFETGRIYTKPGLLDLTHLVSYADEIAWMKQRVPVTLARYLCAGVTTAVSMGGPRFEFEVREVARRTVNAPNVYVAYGPISAAQVGHDSFPPIDGDEVTRYAEVSTGFVEQVRRGVQWQADLVKLGILGGPYATQERGFFDLLRAAAVESHSHDLPVTTHVTDVEPAKRAIEAGTDSLAHIPTDALADDEFIRSARLADTVVVTTLAVWQREIDVRRGHVELAPIESRCGDPEVIESWQDVADLPPVPEEEIASASHALQVAMANARRLDAAGVPLALGVDPGNFGLLHGASVHFELELLARAGIPAQRLVMAATINAARVAGKQDEIGTIEAGKLADLLILGKDPLEDIRHLGAIEWVVKSGVRHDPRELSLQGDGL